MGRTTEVKVKHASADEIVYTLSDGTKLRLRPLIMRIDRSLSRFNPSGEPIYQVQTGTILITEVPRRLKRKKKL